MDKQGEKLMKTLGVAVAMLDKMDTLVPILQSLGKKVSLNYAVYIIHTVFYEISRGGDASAGIKLELIQAKGRGGPARAVAVKHPCVSHAGEER